MYSDLTERELDLLNFLKQKLIENGYPPSIREICSGLNIKSTSTAHGLINALHRKGYVRKDATKNRALEILEQDNEYEFPPKKTLDVPILGRVTAGEPILALEHIEDTFPIPLEMASRGMLFMLNVQGESMIEAGILDGDMVLVRQQSDASNGDIVVALLEDSATVKTYYKKADHIVLQPENSTMEPILVKEVTILGKVVGLYRNYY